MTSSRQRFRKVENNATPNSAIAPTMKPSAKVQNPLRRGLSTTTGTGAGGGDQRMFALDHAARDVIRDGVNKRRGIVGFGDHDATKARVLHETIDPLVASHHDMGHHIDPQPRRLALADAAIEQIDLIRNLRKQGVERVVENFEAGDFGIAQIDHDTGAIGSLYTRPPQRIAQPHWTRISDGFVPGILCVRHPLTALVLMDPNGVNLSVTMFSAKAVYSQ